MKTLNLSGIEAYEVEMPDGSKRTVKRKRITKDNSKEFNEYLQELVDLNTKGEIDNFEFGESYIMHVIDGISIEDLKDLDLEQLMALVGLASEMIEAMTKPKKNT
jgi:hypothetical protein